MADPGVLFLWNKCHSKICQSEHLFSWNASKGQFSSVWLWKLSTFQILCKLCSGIVPFEARVLAVWWWDLENLSGGLPCDGVAQQWATLSPRYKMSPRSLIWKPDFSAEHHQWHHLLSDFTRLGGTVLKKLRCRTTVRETLFSCCLIGSWTYIFSEAPLSEWTPHFSADVAQLQIWSQLEAQLQWDKDLGCLFKCTTSQGRQRGYGSRQLPGHPVFLVPPS